MCAAIPGKAELAGLTLETLYLDGPRAFAFLISSKVTCTDSLLSGTGPIPWSLSSLGTKAALKLYCQGASVSFSLVWSWLWKCYSANDFPSHGCFAHSVTSSWCKQSKMMSQEQQQGAYTFQEVRSMSVNTYSKEPRKIHWQLTDVFNITQTSYSNSLP